MINIKKSSERGHTETYWLDSYHSFSFGEHYDPANIHFGPLRVLNDDTVKPAAGFPTHPHRDMEIVTIVLEGTIAHKDSTGGEGTITVNEVQRMTAGKGILHSEYNASDSEMLKLLQIWFIPKEQELMPSYEQKKFSAESKRNKFLKVVSGKKEDGIIFINQDAEIFLSNLDKGSEIKYEVSDGRGVYLHVAEGKVNMDKVQLESGDAVEITDEKTIEISADENSQIVLFDMALNW